MTDIAGRTKGSFGVAAKAGQVSRAGTISVLLGQHIRHIGALKQTLDIIYRKRMLIVINI
jgi:hypothetical protein